jgi:DNA-binding transcriptional MocR family regulator
VPGRRDLSPLFGWRGEVATSDLPSTTRLVALTLSLHMNELGGSAFPGVRLLARETGLDRKTVMRHLHELEKRGYLTVLRRGDAPGRASQYEATLPGDRSHNSTGTEGGPVGEPNGEPVQLTPETGGTDARDRSQASTTGRQEDDKRASAPFVQRVKEAAEAVFDEEGAA